MLIAKGKNVTDALSKSDAQGIPRSRVVVRLVSGGVEIHNPSKEILDEMKCWCLCWGNLSSRVSKNGVDYRA
jgi:hypothetical protein